MSPDLISQRTRTAFREFLVAWTLREIRDEFEAENIPCRRDYEPGLAGQRRTLVEQYYASLDFSNPYDVRKLLNVFEAILIKISDPEVSGRLLSFLKRDGFTYENGRISSPQISRPENSEVIRRIWGDTGFRVFISHKAERKKLATQLKAGLARFGIRAFVAHEDIRPTQAWQDEIEYALRSMDGFVALLTDDFHDSDWTDQEVGYALARGVPIIAIRIGIDPYGFIGRFQALSCSVDQAALEIVKLLIKHPKAVDGYIKALRLVNSYAEANELATILEFLPPLTPEQIQEIVDAYNNNDQLHGSYGFNGQNREKYGPDLIDYLHRWSSDAFVLIDNKICRQTDEDLPF